jgi:hypothetical protein
VFVAYPLPPSACESAKYVLALWRGDLARQSNRLLTIELRAEDARELARRLPSRVPIPRRITIGPTNITEAGLDFGRGSTPIEMGQPGMAVSRPVAVAIKAQDALDLGDGHGPGGYDSRLPAKNGQIICSRERTAHVLPAGNGLRSQRSALATGLRSCVGRAACLILHRAPATHRGVEVSRRG